MEYPLIVVNLFKRVGAFFYQIKVYLSFFPVDEISPLMCVIFYCVKWVLEVIFFLAGRATFVPLL